MLLLVACAPDPRPAEAVRLLDGLDAAIVSLADDATSAAAACGAAESVSTRLEGVPGLSDLRPTYPALRRASDALAAACGQAQLALLPADDVLLVVQRAQARWRLGVRQNLALACQALGDAARSLARPAPACAAAGLSARTGGAAG